jgi:homoserine kinase type II
MNDKVELLWFVQEREGGEDADLLIGVYGTEGDAEAAIGRLRGKPGFVEFPDGFKRVSYEVNKDHWTEGFIKQ